MFKTIFGKLITIFILVLAVAFLITGITLKLFLNNYAEDTKAKSMESSCDVINNSLSTVFQNWSNPLAQIFFGISFETSSNLTGSYIWITDDNGHILRSSPDLPDRLKLEYADNGYLKLPDERQYKPVLSGTGYFKQTGNFYGFFKDPYFTSQYKTSTWLTVAKSYDYKDINGSDVKIAIYMHVPMPKVHEPSNSVFNYFLISVCAAIFISIILIYIFSLGISRPLKQIRNATKVIAGGEFTKRLDIKSRDEIGELAGTFNQMAAALQNLEEMRRGFIANVSHELRTPMTSIRGFIEGILDGTIPLGRQSYYLTIVRDETNRLNRLVNDLLDLARMEAGEVSLNLKPTDINELVRRCVIKLETLLVGKNITIEADFEEEDMYVKADSDSIERVMYNLLHNAIKFTREEGRIRIATKRQKDKVIISVEDNGTGIEAGELDMIWERFYKSDKSRSRDKTGTGLGLAIVKNIINEHGQQVWVESELGKGTKFSFTLDRADNEMKEG